MIKREIHIFFTALAFYTRIPCPRWVEYNSDYLNLATKYFPIVGWIVGTSASLTLYALNQILSPPLSIFLSMVTSTLITGGFHEDGFADTCDGFGGGWTKNKILSIMKDSVLGTYGVLGLVLILAFKFLILLELYYVIGLHQTLSVILIGHTMSRTATIWMIFSDQYVRKNEDTKSKSIAKQMNITSFIIANILGLSTMYLLIDIRITTILPLLILVKTYLSYYFKKWIGGYTGDCLGAVQQVSEITIYISILLAWKFI